MTSVRRKLFIFFSPFFTKFTFLHLEIRCVFITWKKNFKYVYVLCSQLVYSLLSAYNVRRIPLFLIFFQFVLYRFALPVSALHCVRDASHSCLIIFRMFSPVFTHFFFSILFSAIFVWLRVYLNANSIELFVHFG